MQQEVSDLLLLKVSEWVSCDQCNARAAVKTELSYGELWFCLHHYNKNAESLTKAGAVAKLLDTSLG
jgi:hypothetical protein